jgi:hypothetical protein
MWGITSGGDERAMTTRRAAPVGQFFYLARFFYLAMSLIIAAIVIYGFSNTIEENLLHPSFPRPRVLYVHAAAYMGWVVLFVVQSALIQARRQRWHRWLGWAGFGLGCAIPILGVATAVAMTHIRAGFGDTDDVAFLIVAFYDMAAFTAAFALAIAWRGSPEVHRRLMLIASIGLSVAAVTRFPPWIVPQNWGYVFVDGLIALGAARDLLVSRRIHPVYLWALPILIVFQAAANAVYLAHPAAWMKIAYAIIR